MGYWTYYLFWILAWYVFRNPILLVGIVLFVALRKIIPDPYVWLRTAGRIRQLRAQIDANPANTIARRDLARIYLERRRPRKALQPLEEALARRPEDPELLYLRGMALARTGDSEGALQPLIDAVAIDPRTGFGDPYRVAGDALLRLGRAEDAEDAYEHFVDCNGSSVEGWYKLGKVRRRLGKDEDAKRALTELASTWRTLPGYLRRKQWSWWVRSWFA